MLNLKFIGIHIAVQEMQQKPCDRPLGLEDPLEKEMATHPVFLPGKILLTGTWQATVHRVAKSLT